MNTSEIIDQMVADIQAMKASIERRTQLFNQLCNDVEDYLASQDM